MKADEGYFLFGEDLKQGSLGSTSLGKTWENLRGSVPNFDGEFVMEGHEIPSLLAFDLQEASTLSNLRPIPSYVLWAGGS